MSESSSYYYYTPAFTEEERENLKDFFGRDLFTRSYSSTSKELTDEQIDQITSRFMPRARSSLKAIELLPSLRNFKALTDTEYVHLKSGSLEPQEQTTRLLDYLSYKGSYGLAALYLSLLTSSEHKEGIPAHYQLARELKDIVQEYSTCDDNMTSTFEIPVQRTETHTTPLRAAIKKLQGISVSPVAAQTLASYFNLPSHQTHSTDLCDLCRAWVSTKSACDMVELVEMLVITEGVGRHTTRLCGPTTIPPRDLRNFILTLGDQWAEIAKYIGFTEDEISAITDSYPDSVGKQVDSFLEKWKMPDSGQKTLPLMHKLKALAGIVEPRRDTANHPSSRRPRFDDSGIPPRRLDPYPHPTRISPSPNSPSPQSHSSHTHTSSHTGGGGSYTHYCPKHGFNSSQCGHQGGSTYLMVLHGTFSGQEGNGFTTSSHRSSSHNSDSGYLIDQDPVIEEITGDSSQPTSKGEQRTGGNVLVVPDLHTRSSKSSQSTLPSGVPSERNRVTGSRVPTKSLGNEVAVEYSSASVSDGMGQKDSAPLGSKGTSPHQIVDGYLGNEVFVGPRGGRGSNTHTRGSKVMPGDRGGRVYKEEQGRESKGLLGNEVSMPSRGAKTMGNKVPVLQTSSSLGNEVPLPGSSQVGSKAVSDVGQVGMPLSPGGGPSQALLGNEVDTDSGYTTASIDSEPNSVRGLRPPARRHQLKSDSSSDSNTASPSHKFTVQQKDSGMDSAVGENTTTTQGDSSLSGESRPSSPDNDLSTADDEDSPPVKSPFSNELQNQPPSFSHTPNLFPSTVSPQVSPSIAQSVPLATLQHHGVSVRTNMSNEVARQMGGSEGMDEEENNFDEDDEEDESEHPKPTKAVSSHQLTISLQSQPRCSAKNSDSIQPDQRDDRSEEGGGEIDNDLSVPTPESAGARTLSEPVFLQRTSTNYMLTPDNDEGAVVGGSLPLSSQLNDLSTNEEAVPTTETTHPLPSAEFETSEAVNEYCSEDVLQAIRERDGIDMLTALVDSGANINLPTSDGSYPIHEAVAARQHDTVLLLLNREARVKQQRSDGKTPLHVACLNADFEMVQILVEKGADLTAQDKQGYTSLHFKETLESLTIVKYLAHNGAPVDTPSYESYLTPLMMCCCAGDETYETAQFLITRGANVNGYPQAGMKPLIIACTEGFERLVILLLENNADVNIQDHDGNSALIKACQGGYLAIVRKLCERQSDSGSVAVDVNHTNREGLTPIMAAVLTNQVELVELLVSHGATVDCYKLHKLSVGGSDMTLEMSPLASAAARGNMEMVELLVDNRANINASMSAMAPLAFAAMCGQVAIVKHFLKLNDIDISLPAIAQPFIEAVKAKQGECAQLLADRYGGLEYMCGDATQNNMQELVDSIMQLQQMQQQQPVSIAPSSAPFTPTDPQTHATEERLPQSLPDIPFTNQVLSTEAHHARERANDEDMNNLSVDEDEENNLNIEETPVVQSSSDHSASQFLSVTSNSSSSAMPGATLVPGGIETNVSEEQNDLNISEVVSRNRELQDNLAITSNNTEPENDLSADEMVVSDDVVVNSVNSEVMNNLDVEEEGSTEAPNNLDADEGTGRGDEPQNDLDAEENNFDSDDTEHQSTLGKEAVSQQSLSHSTPPLTASSQVPSTSLSSDLATTSSDHSTPELRSHVFPTSAPPAMQTLRPAVPGSGTAVLNHDLTEQNQFEEIDDDKQNDFSDSDASNHDNDSQGVPHSSAELPSPTSSFTQQHPEQLREQRNFTIPPAPMSAPVGRGGSNSSHSSGAPLRASVDSTSFSSLSTAIGGENLFAPRPKSPPPRAASPPPHVVRQSMPTMVDTFSTDQHGGSAEVLNDFAQICMMAAVRSKGQEWLINKATETGYEHLTQFFIQYFHEGMTLSIGGKLVSDFIGGNPSPLNFLLAGRFINQRGFEEVAAEIGQPQFMESLTMALHQFPGSDGLPDNGSELGAALFNQTFSIGHPFPDSHSLWSSSSSSPPLSHRSSQPSFPGHGHRLGNRSDYSNRSEPDSSEYSNLFEPAFNSSSSGSTTSGAQLSSSTPDLPTSSTRSQFRNSTYTTDINTQSGNTVPSQESQPASSISPWANSISAQRFPQSSSLSLSSQASALAPSSTEERSQPPAATVDHDNDLSVGQTCGDRPKPTHTLTEVNTFDEDEGELENDLTTVDDEQRGYHVPKTQADEGLQLLGNEVEVKPVNFSRPPTHTLPLSETCTPSRPSPPESLTPSPPPTNHAPHSTTPRQTPTNVEALTPTPPPPPAVDESVSPAPVLLPAQSSDVLSTTLPRPVAQPATVTSGKVGSFPSSLTPSPDLPETPLHQQALLKEQLGEISGTLNTPQQSGPGFESAQSSFTPPTSSHSPSVVEQPPSHSTAVDEPSKKAPLRKLSGGSTGSKESIRTKPNASHKDGQVSKTPRGTSLGRGKTATTAASSTHAKQPSTAPKRTSTAASKKRTELGTSMRPKPNPLSKPTSPKTVPKVTRTPGKGQLQPPAKSSKLLSSSPCGGSTENLHAKTHTKKSSFSATKPPLSHLTKTTGVRNKVGSRASQLGTTGTAIPVTSMSRGLKKGKKTSTGASASSLLDEDVVDTDKTSVPFKTLEPSNGDVAPQCDTERCVLDSCITTFPDMVIHDPDDSTVFQVLAPRVRKWKIFGRYLGLNDDELNDIESSNHFTTERCLKMLIHWAKKNRRKYSELEASLHNIMREDLIEDVRPHIPSVIGQSYSPIEEENGRILKLKLDSGSLNIQELNSTVSKFLTKNASESDKILIHFSHAKLPTPLAFYIPMSTSSSRNCTCDLTVIQELCFAAWMHAASFVDVTFNIQ